MTKNYNASVNVKRAIQNAIHGDSECGCCGGPCDEQEDFCSPRCEKKAQGGFQRKAAKQQWDG